MTLAGVVFSNTGLSTHQSDLMAFSALIAHRLTLLSWKSPTPPSHLHWICEVMSLLKLEKNQKYSSELFEKMKKKTWHPFLDYYANRFGANTLN